MRRTLRHLPIAAAAAMAVYGVGAYLAAPLIWTDMEATAPFAGTSMLTHTSAGIPGDPINFALVGERDDVLRAFAAIGWRPADALALKTSVEIGLSVALDRPYPDAPVSTLLYEGRRQDLAFEREEGVSAGRRHHARLWVSGTQAADARPLWLGAVSFDRGAGFSHDTGQITHHIAPDIDAERDALVADMEAAGLLAEVDRIAGRGATADSRNGGGDLYVTDGMMAVMSLKP